MLFELKSVFQNEGEEKTISYKLDISNIDIDGVFPFKTPLDITATAGNRASRKMKYKFTHKLARTLETDGNDDYIETPDFVLDLDETVISDVLLSLPQKNLCKEDCKGLCSQCGHNLNEGECDCDKKQVDPRLEILKQLMD